MNHQNTIIPVNIYTKIEFYWTKLNWLVSDPLYHVLMMTLDKVRFMSILMVFYFFQQIKAQIIRKQLVVNERHLSAVTYFNILKYVLI